MKIEAATEEVNYRPGDALIEWSAYATHGKRFAFRNFELVLYKRKFIVSLGFKLE